MSEGRWVLLIASEVGGTDSVSDRAMERLCEAIHEEGYRVVRTSTPEDGLALVKSIVATKTKASYPAIFARFQETQLNR